MIIDSLDKASFYFPDSPLNTRFKKAFTFLRQSYLSSLPPGEYILEEGLIKAIVKDDLHRGKENNPLEGHQKDIDLHYTIEGEDLLGWKDAWSCKPTMEFNREEDYVFFQDKPLFWFPLKAGQFCLFFPQDAHVALGGEGKIRKVVIKIAV